MAASKSLLSRSALLLVLVILGLAGASASHRAASVQLDSWSASELLPQVDLDAVSVLPQVDSEVASTGLPQVDSSVSESWWGAHSGHHKWYGSLPFCGGRVWVVVKPTEKGKKATCPAGAVETNTSCGGAFTSCTFISQWGHGVHGKGLLERDDVAVQSWSNKHRQYPAPHHHHHHAPAPSPGHHHHHHAPAPAPVHHHKAPAPSPVHHHKAPAPSPSHHHKAPAPSPAHHHKAPAPSPSHHHKAPAPAPGHMHHHHYHAPSPSHRGWHYKVLSEEELKKEVVSSQEVSGVEVVSSEGVWSKGVSSEEVSSEGVWSKGVSSEEVSSENSKLWGEEVLLRNLHHQQPKHPGNKQPWKPNPHHAPVGAPVRHGPPAKSSCKTKWNVKGNEIELSEYPKDAKVTEPWGYTGPGWDRPCKWLPNNEGTRVLVCVKCAAEPPSKKTPFAKTTETGDEPVEFP